MTDWQALYAKRDWDALENWWRKFDPDEREEVDLFRERLRSDVPRIVRQNGTETREDFVHPGDAPEGWRGAAEMLHIGELDAYLDGDPIGASEEWDQLQVAAEKTLRKFLDADEVTMGDLALSRSAHARKALTYIQQLGSESAWMLSEADADEREWISAVIAQAALAAFRAGVHAQAAAGKEIEADAFKEREAQKARKLGGEIKSAQTMPVRDAVVRRMRQLIGDRHTNIGAARKALKEGLGTTVGGNMNYWKRYGGRKRNRISADH